MKNWHTLQPDVVKRLNKNYTQGRAGQRVQMVVIHHNAGNLTIDDCYRTWQTREASAHYQVESTGRIGQLVFDNDTAWHAANDDINRRSIGIEIANCGGATEGWPVSPAAIREAGRLTAAICHYYKLGIPRAGLNVRFHKEFHPTFCPGQLAPGGRHHAALMKEAQDFYHFLQSGKKQEVKQVNYTKRIFEQLAGYKTNSRDLYPGWPQLGGRTLVDAVATIGAALNIPGFYDPKRDAKN